MFKIIKILSIATIIALGSYACALPNMTTNKENIISIKNGKNLVGKVFFPLDRQDKLSFESKNKKNFKVKSVSKSILEKRSKVRRASNRFKIKSVLDVTESTLSLITTYNDPTPNKTIATGLTQANGNFIIDLNSISLTTNSIYILEASKRNNNKISALRTYVKWTGAEWESITGKDIIINEKTTALAIISSLTGFLPDDLISKLVVNQDMLTINDISDSTNQKIISKKDIEMVSNEVFGVLIGDKDPIALIKYDSNKPNKYYIDPSSSISELVKNNSCVGCSFVDIDLKKLGISLSGKNLSYANFIGSDLKGIDLSNTNFYQANLSNSQIDSTTIVSNTDFSNANFTGATLTGVITAGSNFSNTNFTSGKIENCDLSYTDFVGSKFNNTNILDDILTNTDISEADFTGANLSQITKDYLPNSIIQNTNFTNQSFLGLKFENTDLSGSIFKDCDISGASFKLSVLEAVDLSNAIMKNTNFTSTYLSDSTLRNAKVDRTTLFIGTNLERVDLLDVNLSGINFSGAVLNKQNLSKYDLRSAMFIYTQLKDVNFSGANIDNAKFINSNLTGVTWTNGIKKVYDKILYESTKSGHNELYVVDQDGNNEVKLTNNSFSIYGKALSPDKTKVIYSAYNSETDSCDVHIVNTDGTNTTRLTDSIGKDSEAIFSSDGTKIIYTANKAKYGGNRDVWIMNIDGTGKKNLSNYPNKINDQATTFGNKIVFRSNRDWGYSQLFLMDFDGKDPDDPTKGPRNISDSNNIEMKPVFSPDGSKILFTCRGRVYPTRPDSDDYTIWVMNNNGSNKFALYTYIMIEKTVNGYDVYPEAKNYYWLNDNGIVAGTTLNRTTNIYSVGIGKTYYAHNYVIPPILEGKEIISTVEYLHVESGQLKSSASVVFWDAQQKTDIMVYNTDTEEVLSLAEAGGNN